MRIHHLRNELFRPTWGLWLIFQISKLQNRRLGRGVLSHDRHEDWQMRNEGWPLDRLGMLSCVVYFTYCIKKSICPRNPRGISSLIVGNPPNSARWRRITQILGFAPTIVQLSSTVNICESLLFGSVDFWANTGFFSF